MSLSSDLATALAEMAQTDNVNTVVDPGDYLPGLPTVEEFADALTERLIQRALKTLPQAIHPLMHPHGYLWEPTPGCGCMELAVAIVREWASPGAFRRGEH